MRRAEFVVCIGNIVNIFKILVRTLDGEILFQNLCVDGKLMLRWILKTKSGFRL